jgi:DNA-binding beta-propeller fold protein YncE
MSDTIRRWAEATALALLTLAAQGCGGDGGGPIEPPTSEPPTSEPPQQLPAPKGQAIYAVDLHNQLVLFGTESPGALSRKVPITGLPILKRIVGIDFRPSNGKLYGVGNDSRVYIIDPVSGAATAVGTGPFEPAIDFFEVHFGMGFDPATERIRLMVAESGANYSINPDDGTAVLEKSVSYATGDPNEGVTPRISGLGYVPLGAAAVGGAAVAARRLGSTSFGPSPLAGKLLALDADLGTLAESIDPETGEFITLGPLLMAFVRCAEIKIGLEPDGTMNLFAVVLSQAQNLLLKLDALTGKATSLGAVADNDSPIQGIALGKSPAGTAPAMVAAGRWASVAAAPMSYTPTKIDASACTGGSRGR